MLKQVLGEQKTQTLAGAYDSWEKLSEAYAYHNDHNIIMLCILPDMVYLHRVSPFVLHTLAY